MKTLLTKIALLAILVMPMSCCCLKFKDLTAGNKYVVGDVITTSGKRIAVEKFQWSDTSWYIKGKCVVDNRVISKGKDNELDANNVNLHFMLKYPLKSITFKFAECGGNNNIIINGVLKNAIDIVPLNGTNIGGVVVNINANKEGNNWIGTINLTGGINDFSIGGQELYLDQVCSKK